MVFLIFSGEGDNIRVYVRVRFLVKNFEIDVDRILCLDVIFGNIVVF